eukprot:4606997-Amphidinium_carterae.1
MSSWPCRYQVPITVSTLQLRGPIGSTANWLTTFAHTRGFQGFPCPQAMIENDYVRIASSIVHGVQRTVATPQSARAVGGGRTYPVPCPPCPRAMY